MNLKNMKYWEKSIPFSQDEIKLDSFEKKRQFRYRLQDYMQRVFKYNQYKNKLVLEIGCGSGIDSLEFAKYGAKIVATDMTEKGTLVTNKYLKEKKYKGYIIRADGHNLPFKNSTIDCVYSFGVLHHIPDIKKILNEIKRVLKKGGEIAGMVYNRDSLLFAYSIVYLRGIKHGLLKKYSLDRILSMYSERNKGCPYTKAYTKEEIKKLLKKYFKNVKLSVEYNVIDTEKKRKVKIKVPEDYELGWHLIFKGRNQP
ncbi:MAG: class I SAM-dependent methyltransferase [Candidatus Hydrogenedentota bacterium]